MRFGFAAAALLLAASTGLAAHAQQAEKGTIDTLIQGVKADYDSQKNFIIAAAEKMPEENYSFKPTPEIRSYGELFTHVAQVQNSICGTIAGKPQTRPSGPPPAGPTGKAAIIAELKASFDACDAANATVSASNALDVVGQGFMHGSKLELIAKNVAHDNEMYGTMCVYMRLKGIVPPSTAARGRM